MRAITPKNIRTETQTTITLLVASNECETWSQTFREKHRVWVFDKRMLRKTFGLKEDEVRGDWRQLNNQDLHDLLIHHTSSSSSSSSYKALQPV